MVASILAGRSSSKILYDPFPHLIVTDALEPSYYAELSECYPDFETIRKERALESNKAYLLNAVEVVQNPRMPSIWRDFFTYHASDDFFRECLAFWQPAIRRVYPDIEQVLGRPLDAVTTAIRPDKAGLAASGKEAANILLDVQFGVNSPVTAESSVRGPHVDKPCKLFAGLLYFRHPQDEAPGGDLGFYRYRGNRRVFDRHYNIKDRCVERVAEIPYRANTLVMWLNTPDSLHGVSPRSSTRFPRRYVNFLAECYQLSGEGFFPVRRSFADRITGAVAGKLARRLGSNRGGGPSPTA
ncbi:2OG-Fe(II) oxygenase [Algihabitans albus]|uniref:2OG-Fe(II) oxygenase n=1 Tax=Algihabitans albus TaxID=2164067 RepID=UPI0013C2E741|nr:2OG-Fe(II) oxygenase [Algihabitans albus]